MSSEQAAQLTLGAEMIKRANRITGYDVTAFRIGNSGIAIVFYHTAALNEAMLERGLTYLQREELLRVIPRYNRKNIKDPFFLALVKFYAETETP